MALIGLVVIGILLLVSRAQPKHQAKSREPTGIPAVVLVTVLDGSGHGAEYIESVRENRLKYAERHGYETLITSVAQYDLHGAPLSWSKVVAMRHALTKFPNCQYVWYLDQDAYIMDPKRTVEKDFMATDRLDALMIRDHPTPVQDSIIKTFTHLKGSEIDLALSQDNEGLAPGSFIIRNGEWAQFFLDTWYDPLYRSYNFVRAEIHALEHIVQWHPTVLSKIALIPQRALNAYNSASTGKESRYQEEELKYAEGDFVVRFPGCTVTGPTSCQAAAQPFLSKWRAAFSNA